MDGAMTELDHLLAWAARKQVRNLFTPTFLDDKENHQALEEIRDRLLELPDKVTIEIVKSANMERT